MVSANLAQRAYAFIRQQLSQGALPPGTQLVNRALANEIGVSVIPVRDAIHRLASEGLVEHVPGAGAFVRQLDPQELEDLYVLRDALESCAAAEAARWITPLQTDALLQLLAAAEAIAEAIERSARQRATRRQLQKWLDIEQEFHELLMEAARNALLAKVAHEHRAISQIFDAQRNCPELLTAEVAQRTCAGKRELLDALQSQDGPRARQLMSQQIQRGQRDVVRALRESRRKKS